MCISLIFIATGSHQIRNHRRGSRNRRASFKPPTTATTYFPFVASIMEPKVKSWDSKMCGINLFINIQSDTGDTNSGERWSKSSIRRKLFLIKLHVKAVKSPSSQLTSIAPIKLSYTKVWKLFSIFQRPPVDSEMFHHKFANFDSCSTSLQGLAQILSRNCA